MSAVRIVSDGNVVGTKAFDEAGNDVSEAIFKNCIGIDISMNAGDRPKAMLYYRAVPFDVVSQIVQVYDEPPIKTIHYWKGKNVEEMTSGDIMEFYRWYDSNDTTGLVSTDAIIAINKRQRELGEQ